MKHAIVAVAALLVGMSAVLVPYRLTRGYTPPAASPDSGFADRINAACRKGDTVFDWSVGDEFHAVPAGIVEVTCIHYGPGANIDQYKVAVPR